MIIGEACIQNEMTTPKGLHDATTPTESLTVLTFATSFELQYLVNVFHFPLYGIQSHSSLNQSGYT